MKIKLENVNSFMFKNIEKLIESDRLQDKKIILFGLNTSSYAAKNYLEKRGFSIFAYIDNDERKRDEANDAINDILPRHMSNEVYTRLKDEFVRAYSPEELLEKPIENAVFLIASKYYVQMAEQLSKYGYKENEHIYKIVDFYALDSLLENCETDENYIEMSEEEVRECQLNILKKVKQVCEDNQLRYYLCGGTLIGAVRHKGYIPWDDDIDVIMPYNDYLKFLEVMKNDERYLAWSPYSHREQYFCFFSRLVDKNTVMKFWEYPFLMTSGVNIDVFALSGLPEREEDINYFYNKVRRLNTKYISTFIENPIDTEEVIDERKKLQKEILDMLEKYDFDESSKAFCITKYKEKEILPTSLYDRTVNMKFEDDEFAVAEGYDAYLHSLYGEYMELPPENQRVGVHSYKAYKKR